MLRMVLDWWNGTKIALPETVKLNTDVASTTPDGLAKFTALLESEQARINEALKVWMDNKEAVMGSDAAHPSHVHDVICKKETDKVVKSLFGVLLSKLKHLLRSGKANLREELESEAGPHIEELRAHIQDLCADASDTSKPEDLRRGLVIHICNASIALVSELETLTRHFANEIEADLKRFEQEQEAAILLVDTFEVLLSPMIGMTLPLVTFDFRQQFREYLQDSIQSIEVQMELKVTDAKGDLNKAEKVANQFMTMFANRPAGDGATVQPDLPAMPGLK